MIPAKPTEFKIGLFSDLARWRAFVAIAELGSLTRASLFLDCNQSLLSRQLNVLERDCGGRLFNRTGRGMELSELGEQLFPRVKALLSDADQLEQDIRGEAHEPAGRVTLGVLPSISQTLTRPLFARLRQHWPQIKLKILEGSSGQVEEWLADARVDIAILYRYGPSLPEQEDALAIIDSYLIGGRGDRLTAPDEIPFKQLDGVPLILPSAPNGLRTALDSLARQQRITLAPAIEADSLPLQKSLPASEGIYTVLPLHSVWDEVATGNLQAARIVEPPMQRTIAMATSRTKSPARSVKAVTGQIDTLFREFAQAGMWHRTDSDKGKDEQQT
ncbi:MAG: LysR substrate-binding domain-containing protein [Pseudomonadota bacterium]